MTWPPITIHHANPDKTVKRALRRRLPRSATASLRNLHTSKAESRSQRGMHAAAVTASVVCAAREMLATGAADGEIKVRVDPPSCRVNVWPHTLERPRCWLDVRAPALVSAGWL